VTARAFAGPVCVVINSKSGPAQDNERRDRLQRVLRQHRLEAEFFGVDRVADAAQLAQRTYGLVVAAGGDGTVNAVATALHALKARTDVPMGVLPAGTFNYFAREHSLPEAPEAAVLSWLRGTRQAVQVGLVNERVFLVNASVGVYPKLLEAREADSEKLGRSPLVAAWAALRTLSRGYQSHRFRIEDNSNGRRGEHTVRSPTLFVGNNALQLQRFGVPQAQWAGNGALTVVLVRPHGLAELLMMALRGLSGRLHGDPHIDTCVVRELRVDPQGRRQRRSIKVAFDGEVHTLVPPLSFRVASEPLWLLKTSRHGGRPG
jgi:diacylglycerol kinase family enzyme